MIMKKRFLVWFSVIWLSLIFINSSLQAKNLSLLSVDGQKIVNEKKEEVILGGFNLGNWMLVEPWMLKFDYYDQFKSEKDIFDFFEKRFGLSQSMEIYQVFMDNFITKEDIAFLAGLGVNFVRVPFWYKTLIDGKYSKERFMYLDRVVSWCKEYGIYVLIDMHGAPGGQSTGSSILGEQINNLLWTSEQYQKETVDLWKEIAQRYKNEKTVMGYDILNEAYGTPSIPDLVSINDRIYKAIRAIDKDHIIVIEDGLQGIHRLPRPEDMGWKNVVYSIHHYPTWGAADDMNEIMKSQQVFFPCVRAAQEFFNVPINVGEFNSMQPTKGGLNFLRRYMDIFTKYGWSWNIWSYKKISNSEDDLWGLVGLVDDWLVPDLNSVSAGEVKSLFQKFNSRSLGKNDDYICIVNNFFNKAGQLKPESSWKNNTLTLKPRTGHFIRAKNNDGIRIEWTRKDENFGFWSANDAALWKVDLPETGVYKVVLDYSLGVENSIVSLIIDQHTYQDIKLVRTMGGWEGYYKKETGTVALTKGKHIIKLLGRSPQGGVLNLRSLSFIKQPDGIKSTMVLNTDSDLVLTPFELNKLTRLRSACVEWYNNPPNIGYLSNDESFEWKINILKEADYDLIFNFSTPNPGSKFILYVNNKKLNTIELPNTRDWHAYQTVKAGSFHLKKGENNIRFNVVSTYSENTGNVREVRLIPKIN